MSNLLHNFVRHTSFFKLFFLLPIFITSLQAQAHSPTPDELRLNKDLVPLWYNLSIQVYLPGFVPIQPEKNMTFDGEILIKFRVDNPTDMIELNCAKLNLSSDLASYSIGLMTQGSGDAPIQKSDK